MSSKIKNMVKILPDAFLKVTIDMFLIFLILFVTLPVLITYFFNSKRLDKKALKDQVIFSM